MIREYKIHMIKTTKFDKKIIIEYKICQQKRRDKFMEQPISYNNEDSIVKKNKKLSFIDEGRELPVLVQYDLKVKDGTSLQDIFSFYQSLYGMKLDSSLSSNFPLKKGKITLDLIMEFNQLLTSNNDNMDFGGVLSILNSEESCKTIVLQESMRRFMSLFEFGEKREFPIEDYIIMDRFSKHPSFIGQKESIDARNVVNSIDSNTRILRYHSLEIIPESKKIDKKVTNQMIKSTAYLVATKHKKSVG